MFNVEVDENANVTVENMTGDIPTIVLDTVATIRTLYNIYEKRYGKEAADIFRETLLLGIDTHFKDYNGKEDADVIKDVEVPIIKKEDTHKETVIKSIPTPMLNDDGIDEETQRFIDFMHSDEIEDNENERE